MSYLRKKFFIYPKSTKSTLICDSNLISSNCFLFCIPLFPHFENIFKYVSRSFFFIFFSILFFLHILLFSPLSPIRNFLFKNSLNILFSLIKMKILLPHKIRNLEILAYIIKTF